jgi:hypothetical protein
MTTRPFHMYGKYKPAMPSKADLSDNWRTAVPAPAPKQRMLNRNPKGFTSFSQKPQPAQNPFPTGHWYDFTDYRAGLKCELCKTTIRKSVFPQEIQCGHIFCAECIHKYHTIEKNKKCPTCSDYINIQDDPSFCRFCSEAPCMCHHYDQRDDDDDCCPGCGDRYCNGRCDEDEGCPSCGSGCDGTCGSLGCGCIDVCRGRCDPDDGYFGGW